MSETRTAEQNAGLRGTRHGTGACTGDHEHGNCTGWQETDSSMLEQLNEAKRNVHWLVDHGSGLVDMHGLEYWAGVVERLRLKIREAL